MLMQYFGRFAGSPGRGNQQGAASALPGAAHGRWRRELANTVRLIPDLAALAGGGHGWAAGGEYRLGARPAGAAGESRKPPSDSSKRFSLKVPV